MQKISLIECLKNNRYPGRGIVMGRSECGKYAVTAYFIMGRSENSRNRVFVTEGEGIRTEAYDPSKLTDPSLIIYAPVRVLGNKTIVTNGDQTDTIYDGLDKQLTFEQSLRSREFEPDAPNYTPRISGVMHVENGKYNFASGTVFYALPNATATVPSTAPYTKNFTPTCTVLMLVAEIKGTLYYYPVALSKQLKKNTDNLVNVKVVGLGNTLEDGPFNRIARADLSVEVSVLDWTSGSTYTETI